MSLLADALAAEGILVHVWTTTTAATDRPGVRIHRFRGGPMLLYLAWLVTSLMREALRRRRSPRVVIVARVSAESAVLSVLARLLTLRLVVFLTGGDIHGSEFVAQRRSWVRRALLRGTTGFVAHTSVFLGEVRDAGYQGRCDRIPTIVVEDASRCSWQGGQRPLVWCGRDDPVKNVAFLLDLVDSRHLRADELLLISDVAFPTPPAVALHVRCPSPRVHLAAAEVLLLPSLIEGQSNALAEAAVEGTPAVAFATGGSPEVIETLDGGEAVAVGERGEFVSAVARVRARFADPDERRGLRHRARDLFGDRAADAWVRLVREVAA